MSQHPAPTAPSPRRVRPLGALATFALATAGTLAVPGVASAAEDPPAPTPVKISAAQAPKIVDLPGSENDAAVVTNVVGVTWKVYETGTDAPDNPLTFTAKQRTQSVPTTGEKKSMTVTATAAEGFSLASDVTSWVLPYSTDVSNVTDITSSTVPVVGDYPGIDKDLVTLTAVPGVEWSINGATVPAFKNAKSFPIKKTIEAFVKKNPEATTTPYDPTKADGVVVKATLMSGYVWAPSAEGAVPGTAPITFDNSKLTLTGTNVVSIPTATIDAAVAVDANLPGRTRDTVLINPVLGVKWSVCSGKTFAVTKPTVKSASCDVATVPVTATANKGYEIATDKADETTYTTTEDFVDAAGPVKVSATVGAVTVIDGDGASQDSLRIKPIKGVVWQYAYEPAAGKPTVWRKVSAPKKGAIETVIAINAAKGVEKTTMYVRPLPVDHDRVIDGWNGQDETTDGTKSVKKYTFRSAPVAITVTVPTAASGSVTLPAKVGVASWHVEQTVTVSSKDRVVKSKIVVAPYSSVTVQTPGKNVKLTPVPDKDHKLAP